MTRYSAFPVLFFALLSLLVGCDENSGSNRSKAGDADTQQEKGNVIPPQPGVRNSDDVPFFDCLVDGEVFESASARGSYIEDATSGKVLIDMSGVSGHRPGTDYITMIGLVIEDFKGKGQYEGYKSFYLKRIVQGSQDMQEWESADGSINVTDWDKESSSISGTFSTVVKNKAGNRIKIDGGKFMHVPLEMLKVD